MAIKVECLGKGDWDTLLVGFHDANLYQTWSYGAVQRGQGQLRQIVLREHGQVLGCCQLHLLRLGFAGLAAAQFKWGPLWRKKNAPADPNVLRTLLAAIRDEFGLKQGCYLRVWPLAGNQDQIVKQAFMDAGFQPIAGGFSYQTLVLDLHPSLPELRSNLVARWRTTLNGVEKKGLEVTEGTGDEFFSIFLRLNHECQEKKGFQSKVNFDAYRRAQFDLPDPFKLQFIMASKEGEPLGIAAYSSIGDRAVYTLGATGAKGYELNVAYLLQWRIIERLKERGARCYDLGGVDEGVNPGVYRFKKGVVGKIGIEELFINEMELCATLKGSIARWLFTTAKAARDKLRGMKSLALSKGGTIIL